MSKDPTEAAVKIAAQTLLGDLMRITVDIAKQAPDVWQKMTENQQEQWLQIIDKDIGEAVRKVVEIVAARSETYVPARIEGVAFKDNAKVTMSCAPHLKGTHDLADSVGDRVVILIADAEDFLTDMGKPEADEDQPDLLDSDDQEADETEEEFGTEGETGENAEI